MWAAYFTLGFKSKGRDPSEGDETSTEGAQIIYTVDWLFLIRFLKTKQKLI